MNSLFKTITTASTDEQEKVIPFSQAQEFSQFICINDLEVMMHIGVTEEERQKAQRVIFSLDAEIIPQTNWQKDNIDNVVSYVDIIEMIEALAEERKDIKLLETLAEMILESCFKNKQITSVDLSIQKPDVIDNVESVGVKFSTKR
jgi:dihydroneopterin aldolase